MCHQYNNCYTITKFTVKTRKAAYTVVRFMDNESHADIYSSCQNRHGTKSIRINSRFITFGWITQEQTKCHGCCSTFVTNIQILKPTKNFSPSWMHGQHLETIMYSRFLIYILLGIKVSAYGKWWLDTIIQTYKETDSEFWEWGHYGQL
jgi:hypothetical protein